MSTANTKELPKDLAAAKGLVNVQIDGTWIQVPRGTRMIEACKLAEQDVPHYCYHPKLSSPGNCRMCLVEMGMPPRLAPGQEPQYNEEGYQDIGWMPRPVIACANTVAENMGIRTKGNLVENCRRGVMEFLLINHPLDCPICDQAGECKLQEYAIAHGKGLSRFKEDKVKKPKNLTIGPRIHLDDERCVLCSRCIRFMNEVANQPVLGLLGRGSHTRVGIYPGTELTSNYSMNTVDLCPVGALTSSDFRFSMRTWFLKPTPSIDTHCATGINITIWTRNNKIYRITPRQNDAVNSCWMPDNYRLDFCCPSQENRLTHPLILSEGKHQQACWGSSLRAAKEALDSFQPHEIAIIASQQQSNEELFLMRKLAIQLQLDLHTQLSTVSHTQTPDGMLISEDSTPNQKGASIIFEKNTPSQSLQSIIEKVHQREIKALIVAHENLLDAGFSHELINSLDFLLFLSPTTSPTAKSAHLVLPTAAATEKRGSMINSTGRLQRLHAACQPPGEARDDWEVLSDLLATLSGQASYALASSLGALSEEMSACFDTFDGKSLHSIPPEGIALIESSCSIPLLQHEAERRAHGEIVG